MMSHAPSLASQITHPVAVVLPAQLALLVHACRLAQLRAPGRVPALHRCRAVLLSAIAATAQEEDLPARTGDDAEGLHGLGGPRKAGQPTRSVRRIIRRPRAT